MSRFAKGVVGIMAIGAAAAWWGTGILALDWRDGWVRLVGNMVAFVLLTVGVALVASAVRMDKNN